jgi:Animal haem peroxidase
MFDHKTDPKQIPVVRHGSISRQANAEHALPDMVAAQTTAKAKSGARKGIVHIGGGKGGGFFDRMFLGLETVTATDQQLKNLALTMKEPASAEDPADTTFDNPNVPAGFTYLGQFVDHDITLDMTPLSEAVVDPNMVENFRSPALDLDCVYGAGQGPHRFLFARKAQGPGFVDTPLMLLGKTEDSPNAPGANPPIIPAAGKLNDLPRNPQGVALIGDHRNDENLLVAQTHVAFLKFHNKVVTKLEASGTPAGELFKKASEQVRWHYQWIVLNDFVRRLVEPGVIENIIQNGRKFYRFKKKPYMPIEFSAAAYRLGHSMVRNLYSHNRVFPDGPGGLATGTLDLLFNFSGLSGRIAGDIATGPPASPKVLPTNWIIDWRRFYDFNTPAVKLNHARRLDPFLAKSLHTLPGEAGDQAILAFRNLKRGVTLKLPTGQAVAKEMKKKVPSIVGLTTAELTTGPDGAALVANNLHLKTPLWYYILKEAQVRHQGLRLGPVGSRLVAEVFVGMLQGDPGSFMQQPNWKPNLPSAQPNNFTMVDMLRFVGDISPIDGVTTV